MSEIEEEPMNKPSIPEPTPIPDPTNELSMSGLRVVFGIIFAHAIYRVLAFIHVSCDLKGIETMYLNETENTQSP
jgi:hypothetical protein